MGQAGTVDADEDIGRMGRLELIEEGHSMIVVDNPETDSGQGTNGVGQLQRDISHVRGGSSPQCNYCSETPWPHPSPSAPTRIRSFFSIFSQSTDQNSHSCAIHISRLFLLYFLFQKGGHTERNRQTTRRTPILFPIYSNGLRNNQSAMAFFSQEDSFRLKEIRSSQEFCHFPRP